MIALARDCIRYREMVFAFIARELRSRYRGSMLGGVWMVLQPVIFLAVYYTVFTQLLGFRLVGTIDESVMTAELQSLLSSNAGAVSALAMFIGLIPWSAFQESTMRSLHTVMENGNMIKKIAFPSELLGIYLVGYNLVNLCVGLLVFIAASALTIGLFPDPWLLPLLPVVLLLQAVFMLGVSYILSTAAVFVRDLNQLVPLAMTVWFFFTPIFYFGLPAEAEAKFGWLMRANPLYHLLAVYRAIFIFQPATPAQFPWSSLLIFGLVAAVLAIAGYRIFVRYKVDFADEL